MAICIVCFSQTGNNRLLAEHLANRLQCGVIWITEPRRRTALTTVLDLALGRRPSIAPIGTPLDAYSHLIFVGPVWASRLASPLRTFLAQHRQHIRDYSFITLCGYERPEQKGRLVAELTRRVGHPPRTLVELRVADLLPRRERNDIRVVSPYRINEDDLAEYEPAIRAFLDSVSAESGSRRTPACGVGAAQPLQAP